MTLINSSHWGRFTSGAAVTVRWELLWPVTSNSSCSTRLLLVAITTSCIPLYQTKYSRKASSVWTNIKDPTEYCSDVPGLILSLETDYLDIFNVNCTPGMLGTSQFRICLPVPYLETRKTIRNYIFTSCFAWVCNLIAYIKERIWIVDVWKHLDLIWRK